MRMRGLRKLTVFGVVLVTLLFITGTINAGHKDPRTKKLEIKNQNIKTSKTHAKVKLAKTKKPNTNKNLDSEENKFYDHGKFESKKYKIKKGTIITARDSKIIEEGVDPKITKMYKKVKKYKIVEGEPLKNAQLNKIKIKKPKSLLKEKKIEQNVKLSKNAFSSEQVLEEVVNEDLQNTCNSQNVNANDEDDTNQKRKKYKLVEVVLEENEDESELNKTEVDEGYDTDGNEEVNDEESQLTNFVQVGTEEIMENDFDNEVYATKYEDPTSTQSTCRSLPDDPNREGPKKLTLFVIEEEVNGQVRKRVVPEEDGITMCEVAELLKDNYYGGLI